VGTVIHSRYGCGGRLIEEECADRFFSKLRPFRVRLLTDSDSGHRLILKRTWLDAAAGREAFQPQAGPASPSPGGESISSSLAATRKTAGEFLALFVELSNSGEPYATSGRRPTAKNNFRVVGAGAQAPALIIRKELIVAADREICASLCPRDTRGDKHQES
jgi:hypothetical protein